MKQKRYSGIIVKFRDKFLLCKRNLKDSYPGVWSIPGGQIENEEESIDAAVREFYEETAVKLNGSELNFVGIVPRNKVPNNGGDNYMYVYYINSSKRIIPNLEMANDGYEHTECNYFTVDELELLEIDKEIYELIKRVF